MVFRVKFSNVLWGIFMLLAAAFVLANQFGGYVEIGIGSVIAAALALAFFVQCLASLSFAPLPIPLAVLYIIFQKPLEFPAAKPWVLLLAALFATVGLYALLPRRQKHSVCAGHGGYRKHGANDPQVIDGDNENNPVVSVNLGSISRYLHADSLETVQLSCNMGALEVFFDKARLSPNGAVVNCSCSLGGISMYIPKTWRVVDKINCSLGGVDNDTRFAALAEDAPQLTLTGSVLLGGIEISYV